MNDRAESELDHRRESYATIIRRKMSGSQNPLGRPLTIRELADLTKRSYEHVRRAVRGQPVFSRGLNDEISRVLGLDPAQMWMLALREKGVAGLRAQGVVEPPPDRRFAALWPKLTDAEKLKLLQIAEAYLLQRQALAPE